ncbi:hypothetical protein ES288_D12G147300v1 [Gossypium darwinii]|uniref:Retrotransposon Copia-like N-terminal domain-containing protein n=2 Tax=Gossypium TaxID=3633 RepID=A0A5D2IA79_GOSTO|nr:hypothetical protein ES288_D12G147300v1 [Gossypium darwinii]TYH38970.1 hypothetical protein ES332_D12G147000v1 [Gossypium tomentosum]
MTPPPGSSSTTLALLLFSTSLHFDSSATSEESATGKFFNPFAFASQKAAVLVDDSNFLAWNQHVLLVIKTHRLHSFIDEMVHISSQEIVGADITCHD